MQYSLSRGAALLVISVALTASGQAFAQSAGNKVYGTRITEGKFELGYRGGLDTDSRSRLDMKHKHKLSVGYGITDFWWTELIGELERGGKDTDTFLYEATEWENRFELITETDYLPGFGLYTALVLAEKDGKAHKIEARALAEKRIGAMRHRFNLNFERETGGGRDHGLELGYAWQTKWYVLPELAEDISLQPGFEAYGDFGPINDFLSGAEQKHQLGPVALAEFGLGQFGKLEFQVGTMFGVTRAAPDITLKWMLEYVVQF